MLVMGTILVWMANYFSARVGHEYYSKQECHTLKVFDIGHELVPQIKIPDIVLSIYTLAWIPFLWKLSPTMAVHLSSDVGARFMALMVVRALTTTVTILPKSEEGCDSSTFNWYMMFNGGCYDKVFSGHSMAAALVSLALVSNGVWPAWAGMLYTTGMALLLLVSRGHYTVDIVLGLVMAYLGWNSTALKH